MNRMMKELRGLAQQESLALREYAKAGRRIPRSRPLAKPWHVHYVDIASNDEKVEHGKASTYARGCRCELCRSAESAHMAKWRNKKENKERVRTNDQRQKRRLTLASQFLKTEDQSAWQQIAEQVDNEIGDPDPNMHGYERLKVTNRKHKRRMTLAVQYVKDVHPSKWEDIMQQTRKDQK